MTKHREFVGLVGYVCLHHHPSFRVNVFICFWHEGHKNYCGSKNVI